MNERTKRGSKLDHADQRTQNSNRASDLQERERLLTRTGLKEKSVEASNFNLWYLLGLLLVFAGVYLFRRRLQGRF